jgi:hypothetical protein
MKSLKIRFVTAGLGMLMLSGIGEAGQLQIWPDQLKPLYGTLAENAAPSLFLDPTSVKISTFLSNYWVGWAPVNLPVGTVIKSMVYYHDSESGDLTSCLFYRIKMGKEAVLIAASYSFAAEPTTEPMNALDPALLTIRPGYRYFIHASIRETGVFKGMKINY